jgi:hypothetical protein
VAFFGRPQAENYIIKEGIWQIEVGNLTILLDSGTIAAGRAAQ